MNTFKINMGTRKPNADRIHTHKPLLRLYFRQKFEVSEIIEKIMVRIKGLEPPRSPART